MQSAQTSKRGVRGVRWAWAACGLVLVLASPSARGASQGARERTALRACLRGNVDRGVEILTDLFLETADATYLYNQGRCFEQNHRYEDAVSRFREYLIKAPQLTNDEKAETQGHIDACLSYLGKAEVRPTAAAPPVQPAVPVVVAPLPAGVYAPTSTSLSPVAATTQTTSRQDGQAGFGLRVAGIATAVAGGAAGLTAVLLNLKVNSMSSDLESHYSSGTRSTQEGHKMLSQVAYGVGAACILGGAALYYLGWRKGQGSSARVALAPMVAAGQLGAALGGSF